MIKLFDALTDAIYARMLLFVASSLLTVLSIISPALYMEVLKEVVRKIDGKLN